MRAGRSWRGLSAVGFLSSSALNLYGNSVHLVAVMDTGSVNQFRDNLKTIVEHVANSHVPIKVTRRAGDAFVVISADDWEREQETLYVLQNNSLMTQIAACLITHAQKTGYAPSDKEVHEITRL